MIGLNVCTLHRSNGRVGWFKLPLSFLRPHSDGRKCTEWRDILSFLSLTTTRYVEDTASKNNNKKSRLQKAKETFHCLCETLN